MNFKFGIETFKVVVCHYGTEIWSKLRDRNLNYKFTPMKLLETIVIIPSSWHSLFFLIY